MSFFLSSPPQPTYPRSQYHSHQQHSFLTPQSHKTSFLSDPLSLSFQFQPKSPSPLRPSWNAGNVMRYQARDTKGHDYENLFALELQENKETPGNTPLVTTTSTSNGAPNKQQISSDSDQGPNLPLFAPPQTQQPTTQPKNPFQYQSQSYSSRPITQINSRIRNNRDTRRSLFLDRLRTSRRDERDNHIIEKFEKEEYWRERRRREERMLREAEAELDWNDEDDGVDGDGEAVGQEEMSPIDEERDVVELVEGWYEGLSDTRPNRTVHQGPMYSATDQEDDHMDAHFDFEDSDVEEAFMQVLSQQGQALPHQQSQSFAAGPITDPPSSIHRKVGLASPHGDNHGNMENDTEMS